MAYKMGSVSVEWSFWWIGLCWEKQNSFYRLMKMVLHGSAYLAGGESAVSCEKPSGSELLWWATFGKNWEEK